MVLDHGHVTPVDSGPDLLGGIEVPTRSPQAIVVAAMVLAGYQSASLYELQDRARPFARGHWFRNAEEAIDLYETACELTT